MYYLMKYKTNILVAFITKSQGAFCNNCYNERAKQIYMKKGLLMSKNIIPNHQLFHISPNMVI